MQLLYRKCYKMCLQSIIVFIGFSFLTSCHKPSSSFELHPIKFSELPNWDKDQLTQVWTPFIRSCSKLKEMPEETIFLNDQSITNWNAVCRKALSLHEPSETLIRNYFESNFTPYAVSVNNDNKGLFTGYYEPLLRGSRVKNKQFNVPLYKRPNDLVTIENLGLFRKDLKGLRLSGRVVDNNVIPYFTHAEIDGGGILAGNELLWIRDPIDAFFIQIQGSAAIKLENNKVIHINFAASNGRAYTAIGKILIEQNLLNRNEVSMQSIRHYLETHPQQMKSILFQNESYVFFKEIEDGPVGAQGVVLTPERSLAVDPLYISYGTPIWLDIPHPLNKSRIQHLVIAQDKGGAIKGPLRGDYFWGTGQKAGESAGVMKSIGTYYLLLPNS